MIFLVLFLLYIHLINAFPDLDHTAKRDMGTLIESLENTNDSVGENLEKAGKIFTLCRQMLTNENVPSSNENEQIHAIPMSPNAA